MLDATPGLSLVCVGLDSKFCSRIIKNIVVAAHMRTIMLSATIAPFQFRILEPGLVWCFAFS